MLKICLVFWESEPQYAYKLYAYIKKKCNLVKLLQLCNLKIKAAAGEPWDV